MPYVKAKRDSLSKLLGAYKLECGCALARVLGVAPATALKRIKSPEDLTVRELRLLASHGHIPIDEIRAAL